MHKTIDTPAYTDVEDDSIYTFSTRYKNYLLYEQLSKKSCMYNKNEQTIFIINELIQDKWFRIGLLYVEATVHARQNKYRLDEHTIFPLDLEIDEIAVVIDERSDNCTVGNNITIPKITNPYAKGKYINIRSK